MKKKPTVSKNRAFLASLFRMPDVSQPCVSPDGTWVAWNWSSTGNRDGVYACPVDGSKRPVRLGSGSASAHVESWTADSKAVLIAEDKDGDERFRIYAVPLSNPREMRFLTEENPQYFMRGGELHPNGRWLVYGASVDFATGELVEPTYVYRHDLVTGERFLLASPKRCPEVTDLNAPKMNNQGTHVLYFRAEKALAGQQVWMVDVSGSSDHEILNFGNEYETDACWMPDGKRILFVTECEGAYRKVGIFDREDNSMRILVDDAKRHIDHATPVSDSEVVVSETVNGRYLSSVINLDTGNETRIADRYATLEPLARLACGQWLGVRYSSVKTRELVRFNFPSRRRQRFVRPKPLLAQARKAPPLVRAREITWKSVDSLPMHGFFYAASNPIATIVDVHGGPQFHCEDEFDLKVQYLVRQGFNVFQPNYRGSTGYGAKFEQLIKVGGWGSTEQEDIRSGIETLFARGLAVRGRVGIMGISYGGYSSWHAITHFPTDVVAAAAPVCGMTDLVVDYETTRPDLRVLAEVMMGGSPSQLPQLYAERSPINFVHQIKGKLLIVQGAQDPNVTSENVRVVCEALKRHGIAHQLLEFEDEGHGIHKPRNIARLCKMLTDFFREALSPTSR